MNLPDLPVGTCNVGLIWLRMLVLNCGHLLRLLVSWLGLWSWNFVNQLVRLPDLPDGTYGTFWHGLLESVAYFLKNISNLLK